MVKSAWLKQSGWLGKRREKKTGASGEAGVADLFDLIWMTTTVLADAVEMFNPQC